MHRPQTCLGFVTPTTTHPPDRPPPLKPPTCYCSDTAVSVGGGPTVVRYVCRTTLPCGRLFVLGVCTRKCVAVDMVVYSTGRTCSNMLCEMPLLCKDCVVSPPFCSLRLRTGIPKLTSKRCSGDIYKFTSVSPRVWNDTGGPHTSWAMLCNRLNRGSCCDRCKMSCLPLGSLILRAKGFPMAPSELPTVRAELSKTYSSSIT